MVEKEGVGLVRFSAMQGDTGQAATEQKLWKERDLKILQHRNEE